MTKTRVGVLRGGISGEYDISLKTGAAVLGNLPEKYQPVDILIDKYGEWHCRGESNTPERILAHVDVVFNALHGFHGEDGKIQRFLDRFHVPYTGSGSLGSALGMNKALAKEIFNQSGLKIPRHTILRRDMTGGDLVRAYREFTQPSVVKPLASGSSLGVTIVRDFESFIPAIEEAREYSKDVLMEECLRGREATCGVINHFRGEEYYALPPVEIIPPPDRDFFDYNVKYDGSTQEICPGNFSREEKQEIMRMAVEAHRALGLRHYSRSDFIVSPRGTRPVRGTARDASAGSNRTRPVRGRTRDVSAGSNGIYILETNTLPGLTPESLLPKAAQAVGCSFPDFLDHIIELALRQ